VHLPDRIGQRAATNGVAWYACDVDVDARSAPQAIYVPHAHPNAVVYLNGRWLGQGGRFFAPEAHTWNRPLWFAFEGLLAEGPNQVVIGLQLNGGTFNKLGPVWVGPERVLRPIFERSTLLRVRAAEVSTLMSVGAFLFFGAFGLALRDSLYLWLATAAICCAGASLNYHLVHPPWSSWTFNTFVNVAMHWMVCAFAMFSMQLIGIRAPLLRRALIAFAWLVAVLGCVLPGPSFERLLLLWYTPVVALCLVLFVSIARSANVLSRWEWRTSVATSGLLFPIGLHDLLLQGTMQAGVAPVEALYLAPYLGPITLLGFGMVLLTRFMRLYQRAQNANVELQAQVRVARAQLQAEYQRVQELERARAIAQERSRLQREMHDGIGGHLVAMLAMSERGEDVCSAIREAIVDTRLMICSMEPDTSDLTAMLADMRGRLQPWLDAHALRLIWEVDRLPTIARLTPSDALQVARIVQEAVTNVIKHAGASVLRVRAQASGSGARLLVLDDGRGFDEHAPRGRGLTNMRARAAEVGARLRIDSGDAGTTIELSIAGERA
jgi:signal transduction histidine kinase